MQDSLCVPAEREQPFRLTARALRLLTLLEANSLTGPAKAFIEFCRVAGPASSDPPPAIEPCGVSFQRPAVALRRTEARAMLEHAFEAVEVHHRPILERFRFDTRVIRQLCATVRRFEPDIVESHSVK